MSVTLPPSGHNRLTDLLLDPQEALDVEIKSWLDLARNEEHKATLAKALLALANHGGGFVIIGLTETGAGATTASERPVTLDAYSQDIVNGIVRNYAEPAFHCSVHHVRHPTSDVIHPIIGVPGGHRVPIRAKRSGPNDQIVQQHVVYIRRPGPRSEQPLSGREWDELFAKCLRGRRDELLDHIRDLLIGKPSSEGIQTEMARLDRWVMDCESIWRDKIAGLPPDSPARCPHGFFTFAYHVNGGKKLGLSELHDVLRDAPRLTGWNTWWVPTRQEIAPYVKDGAIECWLGGDTSEHHRKDRDAAHSDFWRITPDGRAFLLRGYLEDGDRAARAGIQPGTCLDPTMPIWRIGEGLLHATYFAGRLGGNSVSFAARYTGLRERRLTTWANPMDVNDWASGISKDNDVPLSTSVAVDTLSANLVEVVHSLLSPLYERFDFTRLPLEIVQRELNRLRNRG